MTKPNTITVHLKNLLQHCDDLKHFAFFTKCSGETVQRAYLKSMKKLLEEGHEPAIFGHGTAGTMINLFERGTELEGDCFVGESPWNILFRGMKQIPFAAPFGGRMTSGEALLEMQKESNSRSYSQLLCFLHEVWETYIKELYATLLFEKRLVLKLPQVVAFQRQNSRWRDYRNTPKYCRDYAFFACRQECLEAYRQLATMLDFDRLYYRGLAAFNLEWQEIIELMSICRNHIVHCDGVISETHLKRIKKPIRVWIENHIQSSMLTGRNRIMISDLALDKLIQAIASYGYAVYFLAVELLDMERDYTPFPERQA